MTEKFWTGIPHENFLTLEKWDESNSSSYFSKTIQFRGKSHWPPYFSVGLYPVQDFQMVCLQVTDIPSPGLLNNKPSRFIIVKKRALLSLGLSSGIPPHENYSFGHKKLSIFGNITWEISKKIPIQYTRDIPTSYVATTCDIPTSWMIILTGRYKTPIWSVYREWTLYNDQSLISARHVATQVPGLSPYKISCWVENAVLFYV